MIDFTETQPHLTIPTDNEVHIIPVSTIKSVIAGKKESTVLTEPVIKAILKDWLVTI